jgi:D-arabinose 1-dehydrogenase-like Zn-dependent alcohol dehydrogenase
LKSKILYTEGNGVFEEKTWDKPDISSNEIEVKALMTGVCRSDIDMMQGSFGPLPLHMQGHEGLGIVTQVGADVLNVKIGDYVATRGEPAYSDYYNVRNDEFVVVPSAEPKYILEPVACGINVVMQAEEEIVKRQGVEKRLLILGSGFLAWVAYNTLILDRFKFDIDVVGSSNKDLWGNKLQSTISGTYDVIIDLSSKTEVFDSVIYNENALIILGSQKTVTTDFGGLLWKACTLIFPSPRNPKFIKCMHFAEKWITQGYLDVDKFWTKSYNRSTHWKEAFQDGVNRPQGYSRGYIKWD